MVKDDLASSPWSRYIWNGVGVVVGADWGDGGKGKFVSDVAPYVDFSVRSQGGPNSGHTVWHRGTKYVMHQVPSLAVFGKPSVMTGGMVVNPVLLNEEMKQVANPDVVYIDPRAAVITRAHRALDGHGERNGTTIGTTNHGVGPAYESKANRRELITVGDLLDRQRLADRVGNYVRAHSVELLELGDADRSLIEAGKAAGEPGEAFSPVSGNLDEYCEAITEELFTAGQLVARNIVCDASTMLQQLVKQGKRGLVEGAQGVLLDRDLGTVPYVTSSKTTAGAVLAEAGLSQYADRAKGYWGVFKAYMTRVGGGPFPTELKGQTDERLRKAGHEFGSTTNRPRRTGWFDAVATAHAIRTGEIRKGYITKIDVMAALGEPPLIAAAYMLEDGTLTQQFPTDPRVLENARPMFVPAPKIEDIRRRETVIAGRKSGFKALPDGVRAYIATVEKLLRDISGVDEFEIAAASIGPWKGQTVVK